MKAPYDKHYQTQNLFGDPYPELIAFFQEYPNRGKVLDVGCGQGRNTIALARLGYDVTAIDNSKVGIDQLQEAAEHEKLGIRTTVTDMFAFDQFEQYDFILLDSMFHFEKKDVQKETDFIKRIVARMKQGALLVVCIQDTGKKIQVFKDTIDHLTKLKRVADLAFTYVYEDSESEHTSTSPYRLVVAQK